MSLDKIFIVCVTIGVVAMLAATALYDYHRTDLLHAEQMERIRLGCGGGKP